MNHTVLAAASSYTIPEQFRELHKNHKVDKVVTF